VRAIRIIGEEQVFSIVLLRDGTAEVLPVVLARWGGAIF